LTRNWQSSSEQAEVALLRALERGFTSVHAVFPAIDELGHRFGPLSEDCYQAYRGFDRALARMLDALARAGRAGETLIVISSDHGQTPTHTHVDIDQVIAKVYPRTVAYPRFWRFPLSAEAAVMVSGNSMANVYVRGDGGWHERPDFENPGSRAKALLDTFVDHPAIEHVIYRSAEPGHYVVANRAGRRTLALAANGQRARIATSHNGADPLGYPALPALESADRLAELTADSEYPDALWQIIQFFRSGRAGDLIVNARHGFDLRARFEYQPHNGSHGGLHKDHMLVPALVNGHWARSRIRTVDLFPSILAALGLPVPPGLDGQAVPIEAC
jgi:arylsulfatase A-like enzyme